MSTTAIEWASHVWNPFTGCDRVSPGCAHCYAAETAPSLKRREQGRARKALEQGKPLPVLRYQNDGDPKTSGPGFKFTVHWDKLERPHRFPAGARVFVNSMSDVFHEDAPFEAIVRLFAACAAQPWADFLILTKRAERMAALLRGSDPEPNVWLGVSIENRRFVHRADLLRETPAAVRFISAEPLLGPLVPSREAEGVGRGLVSDDPVSGEQCGSTPGSKTQSAASVLNLTGIDWLIVGGESGPKHRPIREEWVRDLRDACLASCPYCSRGDLDHGCQRRTAFFFKQWGGRTPKAGGRELDGRTWDELPATTIRQVTA
jgi:protein gp37